MAGACGRRRGPRRVRVVPDRGAAPPEITTLDIYRGVVPFVLIQIAALALVFLFPGLATWLPDLMFN